MIQQLTQIMVAVFILDVLNNIMTQCLFIIIQIPIKNFLFKQEKQLMIYKQMLHQ